MPGKRDFDALLCPVEAAVGVIGGKWKAVILFRLMSGPKRFGELGRLVPGVTRQMLTSQLRELELDGLVLRNVYHQVPPKVEYSLTDFGQTLVPLLTQLCEWGNHFLARSAKRGDAAGKTDQKVTRE
jgi:DNA-binding HxlR family transcriptional regulator